MNKINSQTALNGKEYILDEESTKKYYEKAEADANRRKAQKLAEKSQATEVLVAALTQNVTGAANKAQLAQAESEQIKALKEQLAQAEAAKKEAEQKAEEAQSQAAKEGSKTTRSRK